MDDKKQNHIACYILKMKMSYANDNLVLFVTHAVLLKEICVTRFEMVC